MMNILKCPFKRRNLTTKKVQFIITRMLHKELEPILYIPYPKSRKIIMIIIIQEEQMIQTLR